MADETEKDDMKPPVKNDLAAKREEAVRKGREAAFSGQGYRTFQRGVVAIAQLYADRGRKSLPKAVWARMLKQAWRGSEPKKKEQLDVSVHPEFRAALEIAAAHRNQSVGNFLEEAVSVSLMQSLREVDAGLAGKTPDEPKSRR